jgi:hypothetical protein
MLTPLATRALRGRAAAMLMLCYGRDRHAILAVAVLLETVRLR